MPSVLMSHRSLLPRYTGGPTPSSRAFWGREVAKVDFVEALLRHGTFERLVVVCELPREIAMVRQALRSYSNPERIELLLLQQREQLKELAECVIFDTDPHLGLLSNLRNWLERPAWPICGMTHSLAGTGHLSFMLQFLLGGLHAHDSLVCTSQAGRVVVEKIFGVMCDFMERQYGAACARDLRLPVIPLGVDADSFARYEQPDARQKLGVARNRVVFLCVGRFSIHMKMDLFPLILAFSQLVERNRARGIELSLVLAGDDTHGGLAPVLKNFVDDLGLADCVLVRPNVTEEEKRQWYCAADVFVSPSDNVQETFGIAVLEAMASGLPVVASDWNGYKDTVEDGATGFRIPTYFADCVGELSRTAFLTAPMEQHKRVAQAVVVDMKSLIERMEALAQNAELRKRMGDTARERVRTIYDWHVVIGAYEALWKEQILAGKSATRDARAPEHGVYTYDYFEVFKHYATETMTKDARFRTAPLGRMLLDGAVDRKAFHHTELADLLPNIDRALNICDRAGGAKAEELLARDAELTGRDAALAYATRLAKYGLVEPC